MIDMIDIIDRIDFINQYKDKRYDRSDQLTLHTSPTQLHHYCFLFLFSLLIKVSIIVVLHTLSSCWCPHIFFLFCLFLKLNITVVPTSDVMILSQQVTAYCCLSRGQLFLPGFILLKEPSSCVTGAICCTMVMNVRSYAYFIDLHARGGQCHINLLPGISTIWVRVIKTSRNIRI